MSPLMTHFRKVLRNFPGNLLTPETSPDAQPSSGPRSQTHAANDAAVLSSLDGSMALFSGAAVIRVDPLALIRSNRFKVVRMADTDFAHPTHPICVRYYVEIPYHGSIKAGGWRDHSFFNDKKTVDVFAQIEDLRIAGKDAVAFYHALSQAHEYQLRHGMLDSNPDIAGKWSASGVWREALP